MSTRARTQISPNRRARRGGVVDRETPPDCRGRSRRDVGDGTGAPAAPPPIVGLPNTNCCRARAAAEGHDREVHSPHAQRGDRHQQPDGHCRGTVPISGPIGKADPCVVSELGHDANPEIPASPTCSQRDLADEPCRDDEREAHDRPDQRHDLGLAELVGEGRTAPTVATTRQTDRRCDDPVRPPERPEAGLRSASPAPEASRRAGTSPPR